MNIHEVLRHLTVGVGVRTSHHFPLVLKHLHPLVRLPEFRDLIGPFVNHSAYLRQLHDRQGQVRARMETHHTTVRDKGERSVRMHMHSFSTGHTALLTRCPGLWQLSVGGALHSHLE